MLGQFGYNFLIFIILFKILIHLKGISFASADNETFLIVGGYRTNEITLSKYLASIRFKVPKTFFGATHFCCGAIINETFILTAGHCALYAKGDLEILVGSSRRLSEVPHGQVLDIESINLHPNFLISESATGDQFVRNDIAILQVKPAIKIDGIDTDIVRITQSPIRDNAECTVAGWGLLYENGPMPNEVVYTNLTITSDEKCSKVYDKSMEQFCAGFNEDRDIEADSCRGDSGAPLFCNGELTGIVSYGGRCGRSVGGIYTDVAFHMKFINEIVNTDLMSFRSFRNHNTANKSTNKIYSITIITIVYHHLHEFRQFR